MADVAERTLYDTDYYAWTQAQAALLRDMVARRVNSPLDLANLAEEIEDLGTSQRDAVRSQVRRILEHLLKLEYSPARNPRGPWRASIIEARARLEDKLAPSLRRDVEERLPRLYGVARAKVLAEAEGYDEVAPMSEAPGTCPYGLDDVLREGWYPTNRHGLDGASDKVPASPRIGRGWAAAMAEITAKSPYETDYYAWTREQAAALRELAEGRANVPLDLVNLAEEVEDLGKNQRDAVRSQVRRTSSIS